jgi:flagellar biosynthesis/type III secretory pathway chaperone
VVIFLPPLHAQQREEIWNRKELIKQVIETRDSLAIDIAYGKAYRSKVLSSFVASYDRLLNSLHSDMQQLDSSLDELIETVEWYEDTNQRNAKKLSAIKERINFTKKELDVLVYP